MVAPRFRDLYFGKSDSQNEIIENPDEFIRSYVDLKGTASSVALGRQFLVLGPKGTGKSALGLYLQHTGPMRDHIALIRDASSLPLAEVPRLQTGQAAGAERTVTAWRFILLCSYLELLFSDPLRSIHTNAEAVRIERRLREYGFMGNSSGRAILKASDIRLQIPISRRGAIYRRENQPDLNIFSLIPYLEDWVSGVTSVKRHLLLIDGLDSIFLNDSLYDASLASLVQAAYSLNQLLSGRDSSGNIVLLLRNDVFARVALTLPDSQKMRDDLSLDLDWRVLSGAAGVRAPLIQLVNAKAARAMDVDSIQVLDYFSDNIQLGGRGSAPHWKPTLPYFLNLTRHTPRDLLRLFEEIRKVDESDAFDDGPNGTLSDEVVREGAIQYATKYFIGAIRNEFAGYEGGPEVATASLKALQHMGAQQFDRHQFHAKLLEDDETKALGTSPDRLLRLLFFAGAIGNYVYRKDGHHYMQFYHRRDESEVYLKGKFVLHSALVHAWGMPHGA